MTYASDKLHPLDPGIGDLDRPEGQTFGQALIAMLERRSRWIGRRRAEILDQAAERGGPHDEDQVE